MTIDFPNIRQFIEIAISKKGELYSFLESNYRVILRTVPFWGDLIDTNFFKRSEDIELMNTISELEVKCGEALSINGQIEGNIEVFS